MTGNYEVDTSSDHPIKMWIKGVNLDGNALHQLQNIAQMPFIYKHVAAMPDVHLGIGATVGSVIATRGAIIPAAVGVDIGCGMCAVKTDLTANDLPDNLLELRTAIEKAVPHGRTNNGKVGDRGAWHNVPDYIVDDWVDEGGLGNRIGPILDKNPKLMRSAERAPRHLGTLGTGNHFIEVCLDQDDAVWIMLHSGSRGVGNAIGQFFIEKAKEHMQKYFISLPDADLAYLPDGTQDFKDYLEAVEWAQDYAATNRRYMLHATVMAVIVTLKRAVRFTETAVNCHHNYVSREHHFGENVLVTRKGAVRARSGDLGIIPGSMGTRSYIVRGLGNPESFNSCSHGAGRVMSRGEAKRRITLEDHIKATEGVECRKDKDVIDESPAAYKDVEAVMAAQSDLVEIVHTLRAVLCVKG